MRELVVVKKSGRKLPFDRAKLERSVRTALRKRPVEDERVTQMVSGVVRQLEAAGEGEVTTAQIGAQVMDGLRALDSVAYVRFASVYRDFADTSDFAKALEELDGR